ncbi:unnamed protein product [Phytomonas sp. Hart1]|nr:unnamed protein product [Phytomonas sp. Hart1]|eukprot:CCW66545.1 unnamed protein product [Phytomonas sp. isolate Hart1]
MQAWTRSATGASTGHPSGVVRTTAPINSIAPPLPAARRRFQLTEEQRREINEVFELFDYDKNGLIDAREMKVSMRALGFEVKRDEVIQLMQDSAARDQHNQPLMDLEGFTDIMTEKFSQRDPKEEIIKAFQLFDEKKTGKISLRSLRRVARELGENMSDDELQAMIDEFDKDQDGEINLEEFMTIMLEEDDC